MKHAVTVTAAAILTMVGCNNLNTISDNENSLTDATQKAELTFNEEFTQSVNEPVQSNDIVSFSSMMRSTFDLTKPLTTTPQVGDTLISKDSVRIILKGIVDDSTFRVRAERVLNKKVTGKNLEKTLTGLGWAEGIASKNGKINQLFSQGFTGFQRREWNGRVFEDSIRSATQFDSTKVAGTVPGKHSLWAKVLATPMGKHIGDTSSARVDTLDEAIHTQFGTGVLYNKLKDKTFNYRFEMKHQNPADPTHPYATPEYNQLTVKYDIPMKAPDRLFDTLKVAINYNVDRNNDGYPDQHERDVILTTEKGDTVSTISGNAYMGKWSVLRFNKFK